MHSDRAVWAKMGTGAVGLGRGNGQSGQPEPIKNTLSPYTSVRTLTTNSNTSPLPLPPTCRFSVISVKLKGQTYTTSSYK